MTAKAFKYYEQALIIAHEIGGLRDDADRQWNMSFAFERLNDFMQIATHVGRAFAALEQINDPDPKKAHIKLIEWHNTKKIS